MYGKNEQAKKHFNGEGVVDFDEFRDKVEVEAARRGAVEHFRWKEEDIAPDGSVPEEVFPHQRVCEPGQEEAHALAIKEEQLAVLERMRDEKIATIDRDFPMAQRGIEIGRVSLDIIDKKAVLENGFFKTVQDIRSAGDAYDKKLKLFDEGRAQAVALLNQWLGGNPLNRIMDTIKNVGPKNAWKKLVDEYAEESQTTMYLNSVTDKMGALCFSRKMGKVADHMAYLDRLNAALTRKGRPMDDKQLLNYLINSIKRSKDALILYGKAVDAIFLSDMDRSSALALLTRVEHQKEANAELMGERQSNQGAQFARAKEFAGAATARHEKKGGKRKRDKEDDKSAGGGKKGKITQLKCFRCGGNHKRRDCKEIVFCQPCNTDTHAECVCFKTHPELKPKPKEVSKSA